MSIDLFGFIPENLKQQIVDSILSGLAKLTDRVPQANKTFLSLKSDAALQAAINKGLHRATQRFVAEYTAIDEDLVTAIGGDPTFWQLASVRAALLEIVQNPTAYLEEEKTVVAQGFHEVLQDRINRERVDKAVNFYLRCVAESLWHLEPFKPVYELQMQRMSIDAATKMVEQMRGMQAESQQAILTLLSAVAAQQKLLVQLVSDCYPSHPQHLSQSTASGLCQVHRP